MSTNICTLNYCSIRNARAVQVGLFNYYYVNIICIYTAFLTNLIYIICTEMHHDDRSCKRDVY